MKQDVFKMKGKKKKDTKEEKEKLEADFKINKEIRTLVQQNTEMKKQVADWKTGTEIHEHQTESRRRT